MRMSGGAIAQGNVSALSGGKTSCSLVPFSWIHVCLYYTTLADLAFPVRLDSNSNLVDQAVVPESPPTLNSHCARQARIPQINRCKTCSLYSNHCCLFAPIRWLVPDQRSTMNIIAALLHTTYAGAYRRYKSAELTPGLQMPLIHAAINQISICTHYPC